MKKLIVLSLALCTLVACTTTKNGNPKDALHGKWTMTSYVAFMPNVPSFVDGDVIWDFDTQKSMVNITIKDLDKYKVLYPKPGSFKYTKVDNLITITDGGKYFYNIKDGVLTLDKNTDPRMSKDLPVMRFKKF